MTPVHRAEKTLLEQLGERKEFTKDAYNFESKDEIPVLVYGTLMSGNSNHDLIKGSKYLGEATTLVPKFVMNEFRVNSFPVVFEKSSDPKVSPLSGKIFGEVYLVDFKTLLQLDRLESNGVMYNRTKVWVTLLDQEAKLKQTAHPTVSVWMYIGNDKTYFNQSDVPYQSSYKLEKNCRVYRWKAYEPTYKSYYDSFDENKYFH